MAFSDLIKMKMTLGNLNQREMAFMTSIGQKWPQVNKSRQNDLEWPRQASKILSLQGQAAIAVDDLVQS